jgi:hypothetical protein
MPGPSCLLDVTNRIALREYKENLLYRVQSQSQPVCRFKVFPYHRKRTHFTSVLQEVYDLVKTFEFARKLGVL